MVPKGLSSLVNKKNQGLLPDSEESWHSVICSHMA